MQSARIDKLLATPPVGEHVKVSAWVRTRRDSKGGFSFLELNDGSCLKNLQVIAEAALPNYESEVLKLGTGACVGVEGELVQSPGKGQAVELKAERIELHGNAD